MRLHEDEKLFNQAVLFTAQQKGIAEIYVEKDYWVTLALQKIFTNQIGNEIVFKGGTALQKCYNMIQRFSEDIDLVVIREKEESNNQLKKKIGKISRIINEVLPEVDVSSITQKKGMIRKTAHTYSKKFSGDYGQVRDVVIIEASWLGYHEPYTTKKVSSFVSEMMISTGQESMISKYNLQPFNVNVLDPKRTIAEKTMSLVRFSYSEDPIRDLQAKIRHIYDLYQLLQNKILYDYFYSAAFNEMLLKVANDDVRSYKNNNRWLQHHPCDALIFNELDSTWQYLKPIYNNEFKKLVFGDLPVDTDIYAVMKKIKERLLSIKWTIKIDK